MSEAAGAALRAVLHEVGAGNSVSGGFTMDAMSSDAIRMGKRSAICAVQ